MSRHHSVAFTLVVCIAMLVAGASASWADYVAYAVTKKGELPLPEKIEKIDDMELVQVKWGAYNGPKVRAAVLEVENTSEVASFKVTGADGTTMVSGSFSDYDKQVPVNGIEAMVTDVLFRSGRFRMVERQELDSVLQEQDLATSGRVAKPSAAKTGQVLGAQYLVQAVITSYEPNFAGKGGGLGGITKGFLGGAKMSKKKSMVGMNFRLIDAETSEMLFTKQVDVIISKTEVGMGGIGWGTGGAAGGFVESYSKTPIGQAVMAGVNIGAFELVKQIGSAPPEGSIIKADGGKIYVNLGEDIVSAGAQLTVFAVGEELIDPDTGLSLGGEEERIGTLKVVTAKDKYCIAEAADFDGTRINRGDRVVSNQKAAPLKFASGWDGKTSKK